MFCLFFVGLGFGLMGWVLHKVRGWDAHFLRLRVARLCSTLYVSVPYLPCAACSRQAIYRGGMGRFETSECIFGRDRNGLGVVAVSPFQTCSV